MELSKSGQHLLAQISKNYDTQHFGSQSHHTSRLIVRHDLDFSLISGLLFAESERALGINSQYFIRVDANSYNVNSKSSRFELMELSNYQEIGLHIDPPSSFKNLDDFKKVVAAYVDVIENITQKPITLISYHRPSPEDLNGADTVLGFTNFYGRKLFQDRIYISDSANSWSTVKANTILQNIDTSCYIHLLLHPEWWMLDEGKESFLKVLSCEFSKSLEELSHENKVFKSGVNLLDLVKNG